MSEIAKSAEPEWRLWHPLVGYLGAFALSVVTLSVAIGLGATEDTVAAFFGAQVGFWTGLIGIVLLATRTSGSGSVRDDLRLTIRGRDAVLGVGAGLLTQLVVIPLLYVPIGWFVEDMDVSDASRRLFDSSGPVILVAAAVIVIAPVVEELFFRGLLLGALSVRWGDGAALVASSVIFGATHFQLLQLPALIVAGLCFAWLRIRTGALGPAIVAHAAFNACTVVALTI